MPNFVDIGQEMAANLAFKGKLVWFEDGQLQIYRLKDHSIAGMAYKPRNLRLKLVQFSKISGSV